MTKSRFIAVLFISATLVTQVNAGVVYEDPTPGWTYVFHGEEADDGPDFTALDGTWSHSNGSDEWDGSLILDGSPGGLFPISDEDATYLRIQDTGDPRDHGFPDPGSNRKFYFGHDITAEDAPDDILDQGVTISFRARVPDGTDGLFDPAHPDGGGATSPWTEPDGYVPHDGGKSSFTISQVSPRTTISFALAMEEEEVSDFGGPALAMNSLNGNAISGDVDWQGTEGTRNAYELNDPTAWNEFWITILKTGGEVEGTHSVFVYANGEEPEFFEVTGGTGEDFGGISYLAMGLGSTPQQGAVDIDFYAWAPGVMEPVLIGGDVPGDANGDGKVDAMDLNVVGTNWQMNVDPPGAANGDFNEDGFVNAADLNILGGNWQFGVGDGAANAAVPEPATHTLTVVMMCFVGCIIRRRKKVA